MRHLLFLMFFYCAIVVAGTPSIVNLHYNGTVHGYHISVYWMPTDLSAYSNQYVVGPAIITLTKDSNLVTFTTNYFSVLKTKLPRTLNNYIILDYTNDKAPFFFQDLNFDGKDEFIIAEAGRAQRYRTLYKIFNLDDGEQLNKPPYDNYDDTTQIDYKNKVIQTFLSGGACDSVIETYRYDPKKLYTDTGPIRLTHVIEYSQTAGQCKKHERDI